MTDDFILKCRSCGQLPIILEEELNYERSYASLPKGWKVEEFEWDLFVCCPECCEDP